MNIIAVFSSRNETLYFSRTLQENRIYNQIVNTPKEVGKACGISVKFSSNALTFAKNIISNLPFRSFVGFYRVSSYQGRTNFEKV